MKKFLSLLLALAMMLSVVTVLADELPAIKMGHTYCAANGNRGFAMITVAMLDDVIVGVYMDEVQPQAAEGYIGVPNGETDFPGLTAEGKVLASKRVNSEPYSAMMAAYAGSTVSMADNYVALEKFCVGKTIAELEAELTGKTPAEVTDAVSGATLVNSNLYLAGVVEAAKNAK